MGKLLRITTSRIYWRVSFGTYLIDLKLWIYIYIIFCDWCHYNAGQWRVEHFFVWGPDIFHTYHHSSFMNKSEPTCLVFFFYFFWLNLLFNFIQVIPTHPPNNFGWRTGLKKLSLPHHWWRARNGKNLRLVIAISFWF